MIVVLEDAVAKSQRQFVLHMVDYVLRWVEPVFHRITIRNFRINAKSLRFFHPRQSELMRWMPQCDIRNLLVVGAMSVIRWVVCRGSSPDRWLANFVARKRRIPAMTQP